MTLPLSECSRPAGQTSRPHPIGQITVTNLGHQRRILLLTNQLGAHVGPLIDRYARRMLIGNAIAEAIGIFHMDSLFSKVPWRIDVDLRLTLMASGLDRLIVRTLGGKDATAKASTLSRRFVEASAQFEIGPERIQAPIGRLAYNPGPDPSRLHGKRSPHPLAQRPPVADHLRLVSRHPKSEGD